MGSNQATITVDGILEDVGDALYQPFWIPTTGHPPGYTYIYVCDDDDYLYFSLDITCDNTNEYGEDWAEITIDDQAFRVDDFDDSFGSTGFGLTDKVSYKHQTVEMRIPIGSIGSGNVEFKLRYYGTGAEQFPPTDLLCEGATNPSNVEDMTPEFSWTHDHHQQDYYQILVASSLSNLNSDNGDMWDSGAVSSSDYTDIPYAGNPLAISTTYYWKVRTGIVITGTTAWSGYSNNAQFTMASAPSTVYVDDGWSGTSPGADPDGGGPASSFGYDAFDIIQDGVDGVSGSTVYVYAGTYYENVFINKTLDIIGEGDDVTVIDAGGSGDVVEINWPDVTMTGFNVTNSGSDNRAGILLRNDRITIDNCTSFDNYFGIRFYFGNDDNVIENNTIISNADNGIMTHTVSDNLIQYNIIRDNAAYGISLYAGSGNVIRNNNIQNNDFGIYLSSMTGNTMHHNTIESNNRGFFLTSSNNNIIETNTIQDNDYGIFLDSSSPDNNVHYNDISGNTIYGAYSTSPNLVDARYNWWGHATGPYDGKDLPGTPNYNNTSGQGNNVTSYVDYMPWYGSPTTTPSREFVFVTYNPTRVVTDNIQDGIHAAQPGDTIYVEPGTYNESVIVNKTVTLIANDTANTTIDGGGNLTVVQITANWTNMSGFTVRTGDTAILLNGVENCTVENNRMDNYYYGIRLFGSHNNTIRNNTARFITGGAGGGSFHISQMIKGEWEEIYIHPYDIQYSTHEFPIRSENGRVTLRIVQRDTPFGNIERVLLTAGVIELVPQYARYVDTGESVLDDILPEDLNVVGAHDREIEISWKCTYEEVTLSLTANEYGRGFPLKFPIQGIASYEMGSNPNTITVDGILEDVGEALYKPFWRPTSGHPDGFTYIYFCDDDDFLYVSLDVTCDNTNEYGVDWVELTIGDDVFRVDDLDDTYGKMAFGLTDRVSYKHHTVEMSIPKSAIHDPTIEFALRYYGSAAVSNLIGIDLENSDGNIIENNNCSGNSNSGIIIFHSDLNQVRNNTCLNNTHSGIYLYMAENNTLMNNTCSGNNNGIFLGSMTGTISNGFDVTGTNGEIVVLLSNGTNNNTVSYNNIIANYYAGINIDGTIVIGPMLDLSISIATLNGGLLDSHTRDNIFRGNNISWKRTVRDVLRGYRPLR